MACAIGDAARLSQLYRKHVASRGDFDVRRLMAVLRREVNAAEAGKIKVSRDLLRELRAERAEVGRIVARCRR